MTPIVCPETLVANYQSTLRKIPEELSHNVRVVYKLNYALCFCFALQEKALQLKVYIIYSTDI